MGEALSFSVTVTSADGPKAEMKINYSQIRKLN